MQIPIKYIIGGVILNLDLKDRLSNLKDINSSENKSEYNFNKNKKAYIVFGIIVLLIILIGSVFIYLQNRPAKKIVLTLDGNPISYEEFVPYIKYQKNVFIRNNIDINSSQVAISQKDMEDIKTQAVELIKSNKAVIELAKSKGITVSKKEYSNLLVDDAYIGAMSEQSDAFYNEFALFYKLEKYYIDNSKYNDEQLTEYYEKFEKTYSEPAKINFAKIVIYTRDQYGQPLSDDRIQAALNKVNQLKSEIQSNPNINFRQLVDKYSEDEETKANHGEVGYIPERDISNEFLNEMNKLSIGQISGVVEDYLGYYVFKVLDRKVEVKKSPEDIKDLLIKSIKYDNGNKLFENDLGNIKNKMQVIINNDVFNYIDVSKL